MRGYPLKAGVGSNDQICRSSFICPGNHLCMDACRLFLLVFCSGSRNKQNEEGFMRDSRASQGFLIVNIMALQLHLLTMLFPEKYVTLPYDLAEQIGTCPII